MASGFLGTLSGAVNGSIELANLEGPASASTWVRAPGLQRPSQKSRIGRSTARSTSFSTSRRRSLRTRDRQRPHEGDFAMPVEGRFEPKEARGKQTVAAIAAADIGGTIRLRTQ
jgi:hypothetical protein